MSALAARSAAALPSVQVDVVEKETRARDGWIRCSIDRDVSFSTAKMETYFFAQWDPVLYDALLVAAAVEFCDRIRRRPSLGWGREIALRIAVHDPDRWNGDDVSNAMHEALELLTSDRWRISFSARKESVPRPRQSQLTLPSDVEAIIPFSNGLDSRAVAGLLGNQLGEKLVRVRLVPKRSGGAKRVRQRQPFTSVPYQVRAGDGTFVEPSGRSRGFKFALLSGLAAYLANAPRVIVPESGQGALGPVLATVGQGGPDYRSHPRFTRLMEELFRAMLGYKVTYEFPQLWSTKGETLARFVTECEEGASSWASTWSCWQQNRQVSVENKKRQCGICAACMLRRLSVHAAGLREPEATYVWEDLSAADWVQGAAAAFERRKITGALREYAIAGTLHHDHLASLRRSPANARAVALEAFEVGQACDLPEGSVRTKLDRMLMQHEVEWRAFVGSLGPRSFVTQWAAGVR